MNASVRTLIVVLLGCGFGGSALAAMDAANAPGAQNASQTPGPLSSKLRDDLTKAGFTDIKIMPSSFLVRAKDSQGNPVMMVVNPDSLAEVAEPATGRHEVPLAGAIQGAPNSQIPAPSPKQ
ncbi:MAG TPA: hypothetical protein VGG79_17600 [Roseiarcus sp.]|jgi:hypothetical protein